MCNLVAGKLFEKPNRYLHAWLHLPMCVQIEWEFQYCHLVNFPGIWIYEGTVVLPFGLPLMVLKNMYMSTCDQIKLSLCKHDNVFGPNRFYCVFFQSVLFKLLLSLSPVLGTKIMQIANMSLMIYVRQIIVFICPFYFLRK